MLRIENLCTYFEAKGQSIKAVDGVSLNIRRGTTFGVVGESGSGKSWLMSQVIYKQMKRFMGQILVQPLVLYHDSTASGVLRSLEGVLEKKRKGVFAPPYGKRVIYMVEDLHMGNIDHSQSKHRTEALHPSIQELFRQYLDHKQWYDMGTLERKVIEEVQMAACFSCNPSSPDQARRLLHPRNTRHWIIMGIPLENQYLKTIFEHIVFGFVADWPKFYRKKFSSKLIDCTMGLRDRFANLTQASTNKFLYTFNVRHLFRILHSLALLSPSA